MKDKIIKDNRYSILTFVLSFIVMTLVFTKMKMYPFGENQIMIIDSWHQYFPIFQEYHEKLQHFNSMFYSWTTGGGTNFITMIGYYAMSPINLLSFFVSDVYLREFFLFATVLKIALGGMFFSIYIKAIYKKDDLSVTIFGLFYAFSGFMISYYWNIMWLDAVALLPLVILGLNRLVKEDKYVLYVISLAVTLISNFYIGYFVCEFIAFYYVVLYFSSYHKKGYNHMWFMTVKTVGYSLLGVGLAAITLVPIIFGMSMSYGYASGDPTKFETYYTLFELFNNMLFNVKPTIIDGLPNIYSGVLPLLLLPLYFTLKSVNLQAKISHAVMLIFIFVSFNINYLNFFWHGFHFPNQVPFRFSFIVTFLVLTMTYQVYLYYEEISIKNIVIVLVGFFVYFMINEQLKSSLFEPKVFYVTAFLMSIYALLLIANKKNLLKTDHFLIIVYFMVLLESYYLGTNIATVAGSSGRTDYYTQNTEVQGALDYLKNNDSSFYRIEMFTRYSVNDPLLYGYNGLAQFASTANTNFAAFTQKIGMPSDAGSNTITYTPNTPLLNGMFNLKYMISKNNALADPNVAYTIENEREGIKAYKNKYYLPIGFRVNSAVSDLDLDKIDPFERQEMFYQLATGINNKVFTTIRPATEVYSNIEIAEYEGVRFHYKNIDPNQIGKAKITYRATETKQLYVYMLNQTKTMTLTIHGGGSAVHETPRGIVIDLGVVKEGTEFDIEFELPAAPTGYYDISVSSFDEAMFAQMYEPLSEETLNITEYSDTYLRGNINAKEDGLIYTSIPFDKGWNIKVDGKKITTTAYKKAVIAIPVTKGEHIIEMKYRPRGFVVGIIVTLVSVMVIVFRKRLFRFNFRANIIRK